MTTTTVYQYDATTHQFTGTVMCPQGTRLHDSTLTPLPDSAQPGDVWIWRGRWIKKADGVSLIDGFPASLYVQMTTAAFLNRLFKSERIAIMTMAQTDMEAADFMNMLNLATSVKLNDPMVVDGINYCATKIPAITAARVAAILNPTLYMALHDLAKVGTATTGAGTMTLGAAINGFLTFAQAGVADQETVSYGIFDPIALASEAGHGIYSAAGTTLTRVPVASTNGGAAINLSGSAIVVLTALAEDIAVQFNLITVQTQAYTARNNDFVPANTSGASFPITLPPNPTVKMQVIVYDYLGTFAQHNLAVLGNGKPINGMIGTYYCDLSNETRIFTFIDNMIGWAVS